MGKFEEQAKTLNQLKNEMPQIIRTDDKIKETINVQINFEYKTKYIPLSLIEEAKKDFPLPDLEPDIEMLVARRNRWFTKWFGEPEI